MSARSSVRALLRDLGNERGLFSDSRKLHIPHLGHEGQPEKTGEIVQKSSI